MKKILLTLSLFLSLIGLVHAQTLTQQSPARLDASTFAAHSHTTAGTITVTPPGSNYVYLTGMDINNCATGTAVTAAAPTYITTTNITGSPQFQVGSGVTAGLCQPVQSISWSTPLKSTSPGTAVTFVLPTFAVNQVISVNVYGYYNLQ